VSAPTAARVFGLAIGVIAVTLLQVYAFGASWGLAIVYAILIGAGALAFDLWSARRRSR
jgi:uncharacterized membrane protein YdjX (TVP38/TMEM64 family)